MEDPNTGLQLLLDERDVRACMMRYCRAIDRGDAELLRSVYWPGAIDNHGSFNGPAEDFIEWVIPLVRSMEQTMHFVGNMSIEIEGDTARMETYFVAYHRVAGEDGRSTDVDVAGRYLDRMERRGREWRIAHRDVVYDGCRSHGEAADWSSRLFGLHYQTNRYPDDPSYRYLKGAGGIANG